MLVCSMPEDTVGFELARQRVSATSSEVQYAHVDEVGSLATPRGGHGNNCKPPSAMQEVHSIAV